MRTIKYKAARALLPLLVGAITVFAAAFALTVIVRFAQNTPQVGDIVAFVPSTTSPAGEGVRLLVHRPDHSGCLLDLGVVRRSGGSLVVETRLDTEAGSFGVHWAGARTSNDPGDCGGDANLIVDRLDLDILSASAAGYLVGPHPGPVPANDVNY
jgi:hypothetical protein